jgi:hypothetical protein
VVICNFKLAGNLSGCQSGSSIFVESGCSILQCFAGRQLGSRRPENGITADEVGTIVLIRGNVVIGIGPTTGATQNGLQISFGAAIRSNTVTNNVWSPRSSSEPDPG